MTKGYVLTPQVPNIVPLTAVATESAYSAHVNTTSQFERNALMKVLSQILASTKSIIIYPVAIIKVNGIKCRAVLNTSSGNSYTTGILDILKKIQSEKNIN